jgi:error-prone DNA polymerase
VPIGNAAMEDRTFIEWDKDDIDALGLMKVDVLALGMLTCIRKASICCASMRRASTCTLARCAARRSRLRHAVWGDSIGVFQVESRAQMNMLPRLRPRVFYDLVIQVAIVRPGPIQGDMVHPYLRRRNGEEEEVFPSPLRPHPTDELRGMHWAHQGRAAVPGTGDEDRHGGRRVHPRQEANGLRRAMATFRHVGTITNSSR